MNKSKWSSYAVSCVMASMVLVGCSSVPQKSSAKPVVKNAPVNTSVTYAQPPLKPTSVFVATDNNKGLFNTMSAMNSHDLLVIHFDGLKVDPKTDHVAVFYAPPGEPEKNKNVVHITSLAPHSYYVGNFVIHPYGLAGNYDIDVTESLKGIPEIDENAKDFKVSLILKDKNDNVIPNGSVVWTKAYLKNYVGDIKPTRVPDPVVAPDDMPAPVLIQ